MTLLASRSDDIAAIKANLRRVMVGEARATDAMIRLLEAARVRLAADLASGSGTEFDTLFARRMLDAVDVALRDFRRGATDELAKHLREVITISDQQIADSARVQFAALGKYVPPGVDPYLLDFASQNSVALVTDISADARRRVSALFARSSVGSSTMADVAAELTGILGPEGKSAALVEATLRTETARLFSHAATARIERTSKETRTRALKIWIATTDARTRPTHAALNGAEIPQDEHFNVGVLGESAQVSYEQAKRDGLAVGTPAMTPLDAVLPPEEVVNCRCAVAARFEVEE